VLGSLFDGYESTYTASVVIATFRIYASDELAVFLFASLSHFDRSFLSGLILFSHLTNEGV